MGEKPQKSEEDHLAEARSLLLGAALENVVFDGWSDQIFTAAVEQSGVDPAMARLACPRGVVDLALAQHRRGDAETLERLQTLDHSGLRYSEKVAAAVRVRIEVAGERDIVRRGVTFFAMPAHAADGAAAIWWTCDLIWGALGDRSDDVNWYTKRAILSAVYSATLLFWLGDDSPDNTATWEFLDRRINDVMSFEKFKASARKSPIVAGFMRGSGKFLERIQAPGHNVKPDMPGHISAGFEKED